MKPSNQLFSALQILFDHFNKALFDDRLPVVMLLVQREGGGVMGHYVEDRWMNGQGDKAGEISLNPAFIAKSRLIEVCQTLVHEMCHHWQECFGKPSRKCYHNKEWARKMIEVGLMPSTTGEPGGAITGQTMSDYPIEGGPFHVAYHALLKDQGDHIPWVDRMAVDRLYHPTVVAANDIVEEDHPGAKELAQYHETLLTTEYAPPPEVAALEVRFNDTQIMSELIEDFLPLPVAAKSKTRHRYICEGCDLKIYGKLGISIQCNECERDFILSDQ